MRSHRERLFRVAIAVIIGVLFGVFAGAWTQFLADLPTPPEQEPDFRYWWAPARALLAGLDPYADTGPNTAFPLRASFPYPLPAALIVAPLASFSEPVALGAFVGVGTAAAAYALSGLGLRFLLVLASAPILNATVSGQPSALLLAATLLPVLGGLLVVKPTIGLALAVYRPSWPMMAGGAVLLATALLVQPTWPADWLAALARNPFMGQYVAPVFIGPGALCLLAALRWRRPEARLLVALSCLPQNYFFYEQLYLGLCARTRWELLAYAVWSWIVHLASLAGAPDRATAAQFSELYGPYVVWGLYLPCLLMVMRRPNEGALPDWLERRVQRLPRWVSGAPERVDASEGQG